MPEGPLVLVLLAVPVAVFGCRNRGSVVGRVDEAGEEERVLEVVRAVIKVLAVVVEVEEEVEEVGGYVPKGFSIKHLCPDSM